MIAYRLHFDEINLNVVDLVKRARIGAPKFFNSSFSLTVGSGNIRTEKALGGGRLYDLGVYCINAARCLFRAEPKEVDGDRIAAFVTSFDAADVASYRIVGTRAGVRFM